MMLVREGVFKMLVRFSRKYSAFKVNLPSNQRVSIPILNLVERSPTYNLCCFSFQESSTGCSWRFTEIVIGACGIGRFRIIGKYFRICHYRLVLMKLLFSSKVIVCCLFRKDSLVTIQPTDAEGNNAYRSPSTNLLEPLYPKLISTKYLPSKS